MSDKEYAEFNDKEPTELEKAQAIMAKPWRELTWKERLFKGTAHTLVAAAGIAGALAAEAVVASHSSGGTVYHSQSRTVYYPQPVYQQPQYQIVPLNPFYNPFPGVVDPVGLMRFEAAGGV